MKGYKAFEKDLTCRGFQYEVGKEYEMDESPEPCERGFHFCETIANCYQFYPMAEDIRICEIEALGEIKTDDDVKFCTNKIRIVAEVSSDTIPSFFLYVNSFTLFPFSSRTLSPK